MTANQAVVHLESFRANLVDAKSAYVAIRRARGGAGAGEGERAGGAAVGGEARAGDEIGMSDPSSFAERVRGCWSRAMASTHSLDNPALGQCSVTALVAQDHWGGTIAKTDVGGAWHFYNLIDGQRLDFTREQFDRPVHY